jgi:hypothetical protein
MRDPRAQAVQKAIWPAPWALYTSANRILGKLVTPKQFNDRDHRLAGFLGKTGILE